MSEQQHPTYLFFLGIMPIDYFVSYCILALYGILHMIYINIIIELMCVCLVLSMNSHSQVRMFIHFLRQYT